MLKHRIKFRSVDLRFLSYFSSFSGKEYKLFGYIRIDNAVQFLSNRSKGWTQIFLDLGTQLLLLPGHSFVE
jgi:hypothetical protein